MNSPYQTAGDESLPAGFYACVCCKRPWEDCITATGKVVSRGSQDTCPDCHAHGPFAMERDRVHIELWRAVARSQQRNHHTREERCAAESRSLRRS